MANPDEKVFFWINGLAGHFSPLDHAITWLVSDYLIPVGMALGLVVLWFAERDDRAQRKRQQLGVFVALTAMALSSLVVLIVNAIFFRPRPFVGHDVTLLFYQPTDSSFPSNAVAAAFAIAAAVWGVNRRVGVLFFLGAGTYSFARVFAGVHYPADVLAGIAIAFVITFLVFRMRDLLMPVLDIVIKAARLLRLA